MTQSFLLGLGGLALGGSLVICLLAAAGRSTRARYGARWRCWAWLLLCLRLAIPISPLSQGRERAPIQVALPPAAVQIQPTPVLPSAVPDQSAPTPPSDAAPGAEPLSPASPSQPDPEKSAGPVPDLSPSQWLFLLWLTGAAAVLIWTLVSHARLLAYLRRWSRPVRDGQIIQVFNALGDRLALYRRPQLRACEGLRVPMLAGIFRPKLLLPLALPQQPQLTYSLLHELTHFRRRDILLKALALWVAALYWFDPLCWLMVRLVERDTELACDEAVLKLLPQEEHRAYGQTILSAAGSVRGGGARLAEHRHALS